MLVDAVSSSRFISVEKWDVLIQKLTSLASEYEAQELTAKVFIADRIKADNGKIFLITDIVSRAIEQCKKMERMPMLSETEMSLFELKPHMSAIT